MMDKNFELPKIFSCAITNLDTGETHEVKFDNFQEVQTNEDANQYSKYLLGSWGKLDNAIRILPTDTPSNKPLKVVFEGDRYSDYNEETGVFTITEQLGVPFSDWIINRKGEDNMKQPKRSKNEVRVEKLNKEKSEYEQMLKELEYDLNKNNQKLKQLKSDYRKGLLDIKPNKYDKKVSKLANTSYLLELKRDIIKDTIKSVEKELKAEAVLEKLCISEIISKEPMSIVNFTKLFTGEIEKQVSSNKHGDEYDAEKGFLLNYFKQNSGLTATEIGLVLDYVNGEM